MLHHTKLNFTEELKERAANSTECIVLHHSENVGPQTVEDVHKGHLARKWSGIGYHYFIDKKGEIFIGRPRNTIGAHTYGFNQKSVAICFQGDFNKEQISQKQFEGAVMLVALLSLAYGDAKVVRQSDLAKDMTGPGANFPFDSFCSKVEECKSMFVNLFGKSGADFDYGQILDLLNAPE